MLLLSASTKPRAVLFSTWQYASMPSQWASIIAANFRKGSSRCHFKASFPILEEPTRPAGAVVVPELAERLLQQIGLVQPLVGPEQQLQCLLPLDGQVLPSRQEVVPLSLDEATPLPREPDILAPPDLVHGRPQVLHDMELVVDDPGLRCVALLQGGVAERLPHVHDGQADLPAFLRAEPGVEFVQARFEEAPATEPDRPTPLQVADDDAVAMAPADGDLVDA